MTLHLVFPPSSHDVRSIAHRNVERECIFQQVVRGSIEPQQASQKSKYACGLHKTGACNRITVGKNEVGTSIHHEAQLYGDENANVHEVAKQKTRALC